MAETTLFELVSPARLLLSREVGMVVVPGAEGYFGVLPRHSPMISTLEAGVIDVYDDGKSISDRIFVAGGFAEVTEERCTVLAEEAVGLDDIDVAAVDQEIANLRDDLKDTAESLDVQRIEGRIATLEAMKRVKSLGS